MFHIAKLLYAGSFGSFVPCIKGTLNGSCGIVVRLSQLPIGTTVEYLMIRSNGCARMLVVGEYVLQLRLPSSAWSVRVASASSASSSETVGPHVARPPLPPMPRSPRADLEPGEC